VDEELAALDELHGRVQSVLDAGSALTAKDLALGGKEVMAELAIPPGPRVGVLLNKLLEKVLDDPTLNEREELLKLLHELSEEGP
jgi:hypothetical protein